VEAEKAVDEALASLRIAVLTDPFKAEWNIQYGEGLMAKALAVEGAAQKSLLEDAAVSLIRAIVFSEPGANQQEWEDLMKCYVGLGYNAGTMIVMKNSAWGFEPLSEENRTYKTRAFRSLIMMARETLPLIMRGDEVAEEVDKMVGLAVQYGVSLSALEGAMKNPVSINEPEVLTGR
jgi:hypothetical protein